MANKILVVEDDTPIATALELKLKDSGYDAVVASDGKLGFEKIKSGGFDLVLLDLVMPGMNGFEVLEAIKQEKIKVPVLILSNLGQEEDLQKAKALGAKDYFVKSDIDLSDLVKNIKKYIK